MAPAGSCSENDPTSVLVGRLIEAAARTDFGPDAVAELLDDALAQERDWLDPRVQLRPEDQEWSLYPLYRAPDRRCSMVVAVFRPGARAPVHDHGSWAVIGIYRGREQETWFRRGGHGGPLTEVRSFVNETGTAHVVPDGTIHTVEAIGDHDAVSLHVYGTDIVTQERSTFDPRTGAEEVYRPAFAPQPAER